MLNSAQRKPLMREVFVTVLCSSVILSPWVSCLVLVFGEEGLSLAIFTEASCWSELFVASLQWRRGGNFVNYQLPYVWIEGLVALLFVWVPGTRGLSLQEKVFLKSVGCESQNINNKYINAVTACLDWGTCYPCFLSGFLGPGVHFYRSSVSTNLWTMSHQLIFSS